MPSSPARNRSIGFTPLTDPASKLESSTLRSLFSKHLISSKEPTRSTRAGFSLVELLVVTLIMAVGMSLVMVALSGMHRTGLQTAASQVTSGFSLARQFAISRNTSAAFIIATKTGTGLPAQPYKYWAIVVSNRETQNWSLQTDWERLPEGAVFLQLITDANYAYLGPNPFPATGQIGSAFTPPASFFEKSSNYAGYYGTNKDATFSFTGLPGITFNSKGAGILGAIRLADGAVDAANQIILRNTNRFFFVETDKKMGRIKARTPESFPNK